MGPSNQIMVCRKERLLTGVTPCMVICLESSVNRKHKGGTH